MMTDMDDRMLLQAYVEEGSEEAFATLVSRRLNLVYCAALRRTRDPQLAEDITQVVFILLARKARSLRRETILSGWLYRTTRYTAGDVLKSEFRRHRREQEAQMEAPTESDSSETIWQSVAPVLEDAIGALSANDRNAIILRFFENRTFKQVGQVLGLNEDTARLRVSRAVEKLRSLLLRRNVMVPEMMLAGLLSTHAVTAAAPGVLASSITAVSVLKGAAATGRILTLLQQTLKLMAWTKIKTAAVTGTLALLAVGTAWQKYEIHRAGHGLVNLHVINAPLGDVIHKIERQSGQAIAWDRRLTGPVTLNLNDMPVAQVLNQLILQVQAYWTVDYAVYDSKAALQKLYGALQGEMALPDAGWTNLSSGPIQFEVWEQFLNPDGTVASQSATGSGFRPAPGRARMTVAVPSSRIIPYDAADWQATRVAASMPEGPDRTRALQAAASALTEALAKKGDPVQVIKLALRAGTNDGVLSAERMLAEIQLQPQIDEAIPVEATPEKAEQVAKKARASWAAIYTLRQSPLTGIGITLEHLGKPDPHSPFLARTGTNIAQNIQQRQIQSLTLTPEQRALLAQTPANRKQNH
ncbi:MAG TPA: sigma-70 family RNA polymerase sigma factor [Candidatus Acidoferrum sp.]|nr:sigma-70 family RNA polymerase sigma factor [Candidatus Acidoferrum sp.]